MDLYRIGSRDRCVSRLEMSGTTSIAWKLGNSLFTHTLTAEYLSRCPQSRCGLALNSKLAMFHRYESLPIHSFLFVRYLRAEYRTPHDITARMYLSARAQLTV